MSATAIIDTAALRHNLEVARRAGEDSRMMAVIKANAYGHGLLDVAHALDRADGFAVARVDEALSLRSRGIDKPILVLGGYNDRPELEQLAAQRIDTVIHDPAQLDMLQGATPPQPLKVWLKLDSGMHRLGFDPRQCAQLVQYLDECSAVAPAVRLMTHLANADDRGDSYTALQMQRFEAATAGYALERSVVNSAGLLGCGAAGGQWSRPGIMLYGCSPFPEHHGVELGLRPAMTLRTRLIATRWLDDGEPVGYGGIWRSRGRRRVGVAAIGYGDGYPRVLVAPAQALVNDRRAPLVGRVSMDTLCLDITDLQEAEVGAEVTLWGAGLPVEELARAAGTIPYELLCRVQSRVRRVER